MNDYTNNLLVLCKQYNKNVLQQELYCLNKVLLQANKLNNICIAFEVIDLNRSRIITKPLNVQQAFELQKNKPFVFFNCKN